MAIPTQKTALYINSINNSDVAEIESLVYVLIASYEEIEIENKHHKSFNKNMTEDVLSTLIDTINDCDVEDTKNPIIKPDDINAITELCEFVDDCIDNYYSLPFNNPRSYSTSFIVSPPNVETIQEKLKILNNVFQPEQRTEEWYAFRTTVLTASNIWKVFGSESSINSLIYEKCKTTVVDVLNSNDYFVNTDSPMHHGVKYEPVSVMIYETLYSTKLGQYGCIKHPIYDYIAASPDGINIDSTNERFGRMVEIKNIYNREIDGIPTENYWIQMQFQMEVCGLDECDFFETRFKEYTEEEFYNDIISKYKGVIVHFSKKNDIIKTPYYQYMPMSILLEKKFICLWIDSKKRELENEYIMENIIYWRLDEMSNVLVLKDSKWIDVSIPKIVKVWETINHEKVNGYSHREPKRRIKKNYDEEESSNINDNPTCLDNTHTDVISNNVKIIKLK